MTKNNLSVIWISLSQSELSSKVDVWLQTYFHLGFRGFNCPFLILHIQLKTFFTLNKDYKKSQLFSFKTIKVILKEISCQFVWKWCQSIIRESTYYKRMNLIYLQICIAELSVIIYSLWVELCKILTPCVPSRTEGYLYVGGRDAVGKTGGDFDLFEYLSPPF